MWCCIHLHNSHKPWIWSGKIFETDIKLTFYYKNQLNWIPVPVSSGCTTSRSRSSKCSVLAGEEQERRKPLRGAIAQTTLPESNSVSACFSYFLCFPLPHFAFLCLSLTAFHCISLHFPHPSASLWFSLQCRHSSFKNDTLNFVSSIVCSSPSAWYILPKKLDLASCLLFLLLMVFPHAGIDNLIKIIQYDTVVV